MAIGTTRGKRKLGAFVQMLMDRHGVKADHLVREVRTSRSTVNRMIAGEARPRWATFFAMLAAMKVSDAERVTAVDLWERADDQAVPIEHAASLSPKYLRFRRDEGEAVLERTVDLVLIPGMLQTPEYAQAVALGNRLLLPGESWSEKAAPERRDRQALLHRKPIPLDVHALIDEAALVRAIGGSETMRAQWEHLLRVGTLPNVTIQVIKNGAGAYGALSGTLTILDFPEEDDPGSAYAESLIGLDPVEDEHGVARLRAVWDDVASRALSADETAEYIGSVRDKTEP